MTREPVTSSNIRSVGYDHETKTLEVEFLHGGVYQYADVSADEHQSLVSAPSVGSYFARNIKGVYPCTKL